MKSIVILTFLIIGFNCFSHEEYPEGPDYQIVSNKFDSTLNPGRSKVVFKVTGFDNLKKPMRIMYSISDFVDTVYLENPKTFEKIVDSGMYIFQFYYNFEYREIFIPKTQLKSSHKMLISLHFKAVRREGEMQVKKPVVYLYSPITQKVDLKVQPKGKMTFTYPSYEDGWNVIVQEDGKIQHKDGKFNYLFWESEQALSWNDFNQYEGSVISKSQTIKFLEKSLNDFGLNSQEKEDFITFWGPQLMQNESNFIHFVVNEDCEKFADLDCTPEPDHIYRIYLVYADGRLITEKIIPQELKKIDRTGFYILEWGGVNISPEF